MELGGRVVGGGMFRHDGEPLPSIKVLRAVFLPPLLLLSDNIRRELLYSPSCLNAIMCLDFALYSPLFQFHWVLIFAFCQREREREREGESERARGGERICNCERM